MISHHPIVIQIDDGEDAQLRERLNARPIEWDYHLRMGDLPASAATELVPVGFACRGCGAWSPIDHSVLTVMDEDGTTRIVLHHAYNCRGADVRTAYA